jgi:tetratricopeptide (TPR) repeat protein
VSQAPANPHYQRAAMLYGQSRYELAEQELRQALARDPDDSAAHALLGMCLAEQKKFDDAAREVEAAIGLDPESPFVFYAHSVICVKLNHLPEAETAAREAIGLDPFNPHYFAQLASVLYQQHRWQETADAARQGLALDPEDVTCTNLHAMALVKLGQKAKAGEAIATALKCDPGDSYTHANMGWAHLEASSPREAMEHFREALRLDPQNEWARSGIIEAMKARNVIYRVLLGWFLWMMKLTGRARWGVILGAYAGYQVLRAISANSPALAPWIMPLLIAYVAFVVATWTASPLFNLVLRLDRFGRLALSREEIVTSNWVGLCVLVSLVSIIGYFVTGRTDFLMGAAASIFVVPPLAHIYTTHEGWPRVAVTVMTLGLAGWAAVIITSLVVASFVAGKLVIALQGLAASAFLPFVIGAIAAQVGVNAMANVRPRHGSMTTKKAWLIGGGVLAAATVVLVVWIAAWVLLLIGNVAQPQVFDLPIRIRLAPRADAAWQERDLLESETAALKQLDFEVLGDYVLDGEPPGETSISGTRLRLLVHLEQSMRAEFVENSAVGFVGAVTTSYADGREFSYHNGPHDPLQKPPGVSSERITGASAAELYDRMLKDRPADGIRGVAPGEAVARFEQSYARDIDFLLNRGGPTTAEIHALHGDPDREYSDDRLALIQSIWRRQATETVDEFILTEFLNDPPQGLQLGPANRDRLLCIHDLLDESTLLEYYGGRLSGLMQPSAKRKAVREVIERESPRAAFEQIAALTQGVKKIGAAEKPLPADIYFVE